MILTALCNYYQRMIEKENSDIAAYGFSKEKISYALVISSEGELLDVEDIRDISGKKPVPKLLCVPQPEKRTSGIKPCFLWDKTSFVLGVSAKIKNRAVLEHQAFIDFHEGLFEKETDVGLLAVLKFLHQWTPSQFYTSGKFKEEMLDSNMVFRLQGEYQYIHSRPAASAILSRSEEGVEARGKCLVSNRIASIARLHPYIKGVDNAQTSGASIVSFNLKAFTSYGKLQGDNAPVSEEAAFAYTTALNDLLRRESGKRIQIGSSCTIVFWAQADSKEKIIQAESLFANLMSPPTDDSETGRLRSALEVIAKGLPLCDLNPNLDENTLLYILGLSPNNSRLSIRFWETGSLEMFARRLATHYYDLWLEPSPWQHAPGIARLLLETVPHRKDSKPKFDDIQPLLSGEMTRSILTGSRYPHTLLANVIMRMRADGHISSLRVALCKAVLTRDRRLGVKGVQQEIPMSLDTDNVDPGYLLGRLFAELENAQTAALGTQVNATICDRYYGAASATPASIYPVLLRNTQHHLSKLRKGGSREKSIAWKIEHTIQEIVDKLEPAFPKNLNMETQGHFAIGYYHQRNARFKQQELPNAEGATE
ncbi:Csd1 CRISPR-associated protein [Legionella birminghamensis]|uniref:CRISPR-associated protein Cas8c/Csd1, subtype I-C/DVULG n=1 Tax=Legionella birminghamensis TaxID=28083 RepID=A0A378IB42_9GAMM|nr:type I-C CRISPR-associated protein Cas8c/Csd1 [Legionella birminghamensis]KTC70105.1 Csd1 CRISPR-associated protein [Legionella birminghamensis]STX32002.1 CRISPR-associated protein Cas8c/Csd1, subtype I-C/DVULG [Legionella birminghamensis]